MFKHFVWEAASSTYAMCTGTSATNRNLEPLCCNTECPFGASSIVSPLIVLLLGTLIISFSFRLNQSC